MWGYDYGYPMMGYGSGNGYGGGFGVGSVLISIFWVIVLIVVITAVVRWMRGKPVWRCHGHHGESMALDILKERYARGDIDRKEFEEMKKDLLA